MSLDQAVSLTDEQITGLLGGYVERTKFEARVLISTLGEAMKPKEQSMSLRSMASMGFGIRGA
jgi:hypothetical protein